MSSAKELRDNWNNFGHDIRNLSSESNATILRALDLLAATEGSTDEIVRELRGQHCRDFGSDPQCDAYGLCICAMHERAAAALVAMKAAKEKAEAERDELKRHAEAMAETLDKWAHIDECKCPVVDAYRASQEKS